MSDNKILLIKQTLFESITQDLFSFGILSLTVWLGTYLGSWVLQLIAGISWIFWMFSRANSLTKNNKYTIEEARAKLDEWANS